MPSIADAMEVRPSRERRRLVAGTLLLLAGASFLAIGAAGTVRTNSIKTGVAAGGLAIMVGLVALVLRAPLGERERTTAASGLTTGLAGMALFWAVAPPDVLTGSLWVSAFAAIWFLASAVLVVAAVLAAAVTRPTGPTNQSSVSWTRSETGSDSPRPSADGGREDEKHPFPPDDE